MYQIAKEKLPELFRKIAQTQELYLPVEACGQVNYAPWSEDAKVDLDTLKTVKSAKDAFFPQSENLYTCYRDGKKISITPEELTGAAICRIRHEILRSARRGST